MRLQIQGEEECFLGTVAMLSDFDISIVREIALKIAKVSEWKDLLGNSRNFYEKASKVCEFFDLPMLYGPETITPKISLSSAKKVFPLKGKGTIFILWTDNSAHIMAFEDEKIFDSNGFIYENFAEMKKIIPSIYGRKIKRIEVTLISL